MVGLQWTTLYVVTVTDGLDSVVVTVVRLKLIVSCILGLVLSLLSLHIKLVN